MSLQKPLHQSEVLALQSQEERIQAVVVLLDQQIMLKCGFIEALNHLEDLYG